MYDSIKNYARIADSECICCEHPKEEIVFHVFINRDIASKVWKFFGEPMGISMQKQSIQSMIMSWWNFNTKNSMIRVICQSLPVFICWELWKFWSYVKYGHKSYFVNKICYEVTQHLKVFMNKKAYKLDPNCNWRGICNLIEAYKTRLSNRPVIWDKPPHSVIKINIDGSSLAQFGKAGIGGIATDSNGDIIMDFAKSLPYCSNNSAEIKVASFGISWREHNGINNCILEVDSMLVVKWLKGSYTTPWEFAQEVEHMKRIIERRHIKIQHFFREANIVADALAKFGSNSQHSLIANVFNSMQEMPSEARGAARMDKAQMANFKIRHSR
ncbi:uncharacterized protein LOC132607713 [Lycium barbarum]|uniref:uncharacterized protein LOC132607713 n=1 Tax=Lycium barbarum TaxID=112863 RepID=UPI00293EC82E|nr:uncharacterized protein LOC132607713 [Lycium barbarum]